MSDEKDALAVMRLSAKSLRSYESNNRRAYSETKNAFDSLLADTHAAAAKVYEDALARHLWMVAEELGEALTKKAGGTR